MMSEIEGGAVLVGYETTINQLLAFSLEPMVGIRLSKSRDPASKMTLAGKEVPASGGFDNKYAYYVGENLASGWIGMRNALVKCVGRSLNFGTIPSSWKININAHAINLMKAFFGVTYFSLPHTVIFDDLLSTIGCGRYRRTLLNLGWVTFYFLSNN